MCIPLFIKESTMENALIVTVLVLALAIALFALWRRKSSRGCCGGAAYRAKKKRLASVRYEKTFRVEGMHCKSCSARVEEIVNDIVGVAGRVDLKAGTLTVLYAKDVSDELIAIRLAAHGYLVTPL